jgi:beta-xylosidase
MWMHLEADRYTYARAGIATGDTPGGQFTFLQAIRPITNDFNFVPAAATQQKQFGGTYRDMNLFVDEDGRAYAFYSSEDNWTMYVVRLNAEFTGPEAPAVEGKTWARILVRQMREAPAPFKHNGRYYLVTSGCTGWKPNEASYAVADNIFGPWKGMNNPCVGPDANTTFGSQSTFVLPRPGNTGRFVFMADRWNPQNLSDSRYVWLPLTVGPDEKVVIEWKDEWKPADFGD